MNTSGGFSEYIRVPSEWVVKKPEGISLSESMALGTAGLTAGLCVRKLINHKLTPDSGKLFVTGATGGVGIVAMMLLSKLGFEVVAITGKLESQDMLKKYGASEVITREDLDQPLISLYKNLFMLGVLMRLVETFYQILFVQPHKEQQLLVVVWLMALTLTRVFFLLF